MKLKFNPEDWKELHKYLAKWDEWRRKKPTGRPDWTSDTIFLVPMIIALMKAQDRLEKLTTTLVILTIILAILAIISLYNLLV